VRTVVIVLGLATALIHLSLNFPPTIRPPELLFTLNGLGYLALVAAFAFDPPVVREHRRALHYLFIAYTLVTILGWVAIGARNVVGYTDKAVEIVLVLALWRHLRDLRAGSPVRGFR